MKVLPEIPFSFGHSFLLRSSIPGAFLSGGVYFFGYAFWPAGDWTTKVSFLVIGVIVLGSLVAAANPLITYLYSGRDWWPWIADGLVRRLNRKIARSIDQAHGALDAGHLRKFDDIWDWLRYFPTEELRERDATSGQVSQEFDIGRLPDALRAKVQHDKKAGTLVFHGVMEGPEKEALKSLASDKEGRRAIESLYWRSQPQPRAYRPTIFGNILAEYKNYGDTRYGLDTEFVWYRMWMSMDKDLKQDIAGVAAEVDCVTHCSFVCYSLGLAYALSGLALMILGTYASDAVSLLANVQKYQWWWRSLALAGVMLLLIGYLFYLWSLPLLRTYGDTLKAAHDVLKGKVYALRIPSRAERDLWRQTTLYFQYHKLECGRCQTVYFARLDKCPQCNTENPYRR